MPNTVYDLLIYLLAFYGVISLILCIWDTLYVKDQQACNEMRVILTVLNQEDRIEGTVLDFLGKNGFFKNHCRIRLAVVDMGSKDETMTILYKLQERYPQLEIYHVDEKEKIFDGSY